MASDEDQINHVKLIETKIPKANKDPGSCGSSRFKAGRADSGKKNKLDITGLEVMSCTHGHIVYSANLFKGETYKHTHLQHLKSSSLEAEFFCNDVVCHYWPFAEKVANLFPEREDFSQAVNQQQWFLSRFHGQAHTWDCRVRNVNLIESNFL